MKTENEIMIQILSEYDCAKKEYEYYKGQNAEHTQSYYSGRMNACKDLLLELFNYSPY